MENRVSFFMGANTPKGFTSLFDGLYEPFGSRRCYIIKGGPGTGKSSFMRAVAKAAESRGHTCEYIHCASDPHSLDAIIIPELDVCFADGTAPHVIEPRFPGVTEQIINLGDHWNERKLCENANAIRRLTAECSALHARSIRFLQAAGALQNDMHFICSRYVDETKINSYAVRFASREFTCRSEIHGKEIRRFLSAVTPEGVFTHKNTVRLLCDRVIGIDDEHCVASGLLLESIKNEALSRGHDVITCRCPLNPDGYPEHLLIPSVSLAFVTLRHAHSMPEPDRIVHITRFVEREGIRSHKNRLAFTSRACDELTQEAVQLMAQAKSTHDELEKYYISAMDFESVQRRCSQVIDMIM